MNAKKKEENLVENGGTNDKENEKYEMREQDQRADEVRTLPCLFLRNCCPGGRIFHISS